jgi:hypothetical protein
MNRWLQVGVWTAAGLLPALAVAQPAVSLSDLQELQKKNALTPEELQTVRTWVEQQVRALLEGNGDAVTQLFAQSNGTPAYKEAYVGACIAVIGPNYGRADLAAAAQLVTLLHRLNDARVYEVLLEALRDERPAVRTAAAVGLRELRSELVSTSAEAVSGVIRALREAGKKETSYVALKRIYEAMDYASINAAPDRKALAQALLDVLETRSENYETENPSAWGAETVGLRVIGPLRSNLDDAERKRLTEAIARMMRAAINRYSAHLHSVEDESGSPLEVALRNRTEQLIMQAEPLLAELVQPPAAQRPDVAGEMTDGQVINMKVEWKDWADLLQDAIGKDFHIETDEDEDG